MPPAGGTCITKAGKCGVVLVKHEAECGVHIGAGLGDGFHGGQGRSRPGEMLRHADIEAREVRFMVTSAAELGPVLGNVLEATDVATGLAHSSLCNLRPDVSEAVMEPVAAVHRHCVDESEPARPLASATERYFGKQPSSTRCDFRAARHSRMSTTKARALSGESGGCSWYDHIAPVGPMVRWLRHRFSTSE